MSFVDHTVKTKPRLLTVSESCRYQPRITISGAWLCDWGFSIGDPVRLLNINPGLVLIKIGEWSCWPDVSKYCQPGIPPKMLVREPPSYRLFPSSHNCPGIVITGAWLGNWGFNIDARISLTKTDDGYVLMKVIMPASEWRQVLRKKKLEREAKFAIGILEIHKAAHPGLYPDEAPTPTRKRAAAFKPAKPAQPSLFEHSAATREYTADVAARSANALIPD